MDKEIVSLVQRQGDCRLIVFRGAHPTGRGSYAFDETLSERDRRELAYLMLLNMLPTYAELAALGILVDVHVEWQRQDVDAMRAAYERAQRELEIDDTRGFDREGNQLWQWLLRNQSYYLFTDLEAAIAGFLPGVLDLVERSAPAVERMIAEYRGAGSPPPLATRRSSIMPAVRPIDD